MRFTAARFTGAGEKPALPPPSLHKSISLERRQPAVSQRCVCVCAYTAKEFLWAKKQLESINSLAGIYLTNTILFVHSQVE